MDVLVAQISSILSKELGKSHRNNNDTKILIEGVGGKVSCVFEGHRNGPNALPSMFQALRPVSPLDTPSDDWLPAQNQVCLWRDSNNMSLNQIGLCFTAYTGSVSIRKGTIEVHAEISFEAKNNYSVKANQ